MTRLRRGFWRVCVVWSRCAAPGEGFSRIGVACMTSFNMGNLNWTYTLRSGFINVDGWRTEPPQSGRKKYRAYPSDWMSVCCHAAEASAKMLASGRAQSNSNQILINVYGYSHQVSLTLAQEFWLNWVHKICDGRTDGQHKIYMSPLEGGIHNSDDSPFFCLLLLRKAWMYLNGRCRTLLYANKTN